MEFFQALMIEDYVHHLDKGLMPISNLLKFNKFVFSNQLLEDDQVEKKYYSTFIDFKNNVEPDGWFLLPCYTSKTIKKIFHINQILPLLNSI